MKQNFVPLGVINLVKLFVEHIFHHQLVNLVGYDDVCDVPRHLTITFLVLEFE
jgi:hypothetical protein